jgi:hypothetical protein
MSRDAGDCSAPQDEPLGSRSCELVLTDPVRFTRAARADARRTRP